MKAAFGLVSLMIVAFIVMYLWSQHTAEVVKVSQPAQRQAEQFAGVDENGMRVKDSIQLEPFESGGKMRYLHVTDVAAGGPMEAFYGMKRDDQILAVGPIDFRGSNDAELAIAMVWEARQRNAQMKVRRDGQEFMVGNDGTRPVWQPTGKGVAGTATPSQDSAQPPASSDRPAPPARDNTKALNRQLDAIPGIAR